MLRSDLSREGTESTPVDVTDDSSIIAKYPDVPGMSEKATTLIQRKRDLILNSKRFAYHYSLFLIFLTKNYLRKIYSKESVIYFKDEIG